MCAALPLPPCPTPAGATGLTGPAGQVCWGGEATGRLVPAPNGGPYPRQRAQTPIGSPPPLTLYTAGGGISSRQRPPPGREKVPIARPTLAPRLLFLYRAPWPPRPTVSRGG